MSNLSEKPKPPQTPGAPKPPPVPAQPPARRPLSGRPLELSEKPIGHNGRWLGFQVPAHKAPTEKTIAWWGLQKKLPAWLVRAMEHGQPVNKEFTESDIDELAHKVAGLPLGRKGA